MQVISSNLDIHSDAYRRNRDRTLGVLRELDGMYLDAHKGGGEEAMARLLAQNKMPVRERVAMVLDRDSPFLEISPLAAANNPEMANGGGFVLGIGVISGTECVVMGHDPSVRAGAGNAYNGKRQNRGLQIARINRMPCIQFVESAGADLRGNPGGGGARNPDLQRLIPRGAPGHFAESGRLFYDITELSQMRIPTIAVVCGTATAGGAYQPGMSDYNIFVRNQARVALGGVPLVKMATGEDADAESLSGAEMHTQISGLGDYLAQDEVDGARLCREVVRHLNWRKLGPGPSLPPDPPVYDPEELLGIVDDDLTKPFDMREVIARVVDGSVFEDFKPLYGPTLVCGWGSIDGYPVGIIGNNGPLFPDACDKGAQFIQLCNQIDVPLLFLHNTTGFMVGEDFEHGGMIKNGAKMLNTVANSTVPHIGVIVGASYGASHYAMSSRAYGTRFTFAWPTAKVAETWPDQIAQDIRTADREATERSGERFDDDAYAREMDNVTYEADERSKGINITSAVADDGLIDPRDTRACLAIALSACHSNKVEGAKEYAVWRM